ncbi:RagB/SusD family nutrient uptake outer membrane protein [Rudanella paleaurantiibacter]|uniref:RagB/SusD family nutrient uptake outer membrane protein n=1 Tax=Rudanella paleaurantiibacter TaxID=2614655 RepID=A0A7J5TS64_9BACT|nr:RagB/SusD family nutrient uptake outer membrane protein [Rudanella paleaurantiibacter]KAB7726112.1 RagB/SusD family nutrient uptake outer membrane protein [Rudanella paleaurantiibacter]
MKKTRLYLSMLAGLMLLNSCSFFELEAPNDPNNPSLGSVSQNASRTQVQNLVTGLESRHRDYVFNVTMLFGTMGRELWYLNASDPRWQTDWLGMNNRTANPNMFNYLPTYTNPYFAIRQGLTVVDAVRNTNAFTDQEKNAVSGFAKTIMAYQYLIVAMGQYENGIRMNIADIQNPGPFVPLPEALTQIRQLLDEANTELTNGGTGNFPLRLTSGFTANGFNTIASLRQLNRAIAARLAVYRQDWQGALEAANASFYNATGNLDAGPAHTYGAPPDQFNPLFFVLNANVTTMMVVHPSVLRDTLANDARVRAKFFRRTAPVSVTSDGTPLSGQYQDRRFPVNTSELKFFRNEELVLIVAEANAQLGNTQAALAAINRIRTAAGVGNYTGATTREALIDEILFQRRYSLWAEPWGHRWVDLRRYNRLNAQNVDVTLDRGSIFRQLARPQAEINWDEYVLTR